MIIGRIKIRTGGLFDVAMFIGGAKWLNIYRFSMRIGGHVGEITC